MFSIDYLLVGEMRLGFIGIFADCRESCEVLWPLIAGGGGGGGVVRECEDLVPNAGGIVITEDVDGLLSVGLTELDLVDEFDGISDLADGGKT